MNNVVIDNGYYSTKIFQPSKLYSFRSKIQETNTPLNHTNTHFLIYNSKSYLVGDGAENIDINLNKSNSELHYLTTLTALGLISFQASFNLVANLPINLYTKLNKEAFENRLRSTTPINYTLNNKHISISIPNIVVFPQCFSAIYVNNIKSNIIGILDLGGLTAQGCICEGKNLIFSSIFSDNLGTLVLYNKIKKSLNAQYNLNIQDYEVENIIKNGISFDKTNSLKLISSICTSHVDQIIKGMKLTGWNIENMPILLTGGGTLLLESYLKQYLPIYQVSNDPLYDNIKGLWEVSKYVF